MGPDSQASFPEFQQNSASLFATQRISKSVHQNFHPKEDNYVQVNHDHKSIFHLTTFQNPYISAFQFSFKQEQSWKKSLKHKAHVPET